MDRERKIVSGVLNTHLKGCHPDGTDTWRGGSRPRPIGWSNTLPGPPSREDGGGAGVMRFIKISLDRFFIINWQMNVLFRGGRRVTTRRLWVRKGGPRMMTGIREFIMPPSGRHYHRQLCHWRSPSLSARWLECHQPHRESLLLVSSSVDTGAIKVEMGFLLYSFLLMELTAVEAIYWDCPWWWRIED